VSSYCEFAPGQAYHAAYHEHEYGFPLEHDDALFGRLLLEINQAGLSWLTILRKKAAFEAAYDGFSVDRVAAYGPAERQRLLQDAGIVRNRLKIDAAIENARRIQELQRDYGSFRAWLDAHHPRPLEEWTRLFRKQFRFTGGEIVKEFLVSTGYLPGAHQVSCSVYPRILAAQPPWARDAAPR
jgi:DNA-3-methyladenine glycosylase I